MTKQEKKQLLEKLGKEKIKLEKKIEQLKEMTQPIEPDCAIGRVSRMDAINNKSVNEAALRATKESYSNVLQSLATIDKPDFGLCRVCGQKIPFSRLYVMPGSTRCVKCASRR
ncbi:MAG: TraR/DksA C4-type zinc finger protein [Bacteroidota bacterium]|nr:TraR/DksA C4-type zinc finger protein [Bacteroidota bacterium]